MERLTTRSKFAALAGVSPAAITRVSRTILAPACVGNRINLEHPAAIAYLERSHLKPPAVPVAGATEPGAPPATQSTQSPGRSRAPGAPAAGAPPATQSPETPAALKRNPRVRPKRDPGERAPKAPPPPPPVSAPPAAPGATSDPVIHDGSDMQRYGDMTLRELVAQFGTDVRFLDWLRASQTLEAIQEKRIKNAQATGDLVARELVRRSVMDPVAETATKLLTDAARTISTRATTMAAAGSPATEVEGVVVDILQSYIKPLKEKMRRAIVTGS